LSLSSCLLASASCLLLLLSPGCEKAETGQGGGAPIEFAVFEGGYGLDWHFGVSRAYEALYPSVRINVWGSPRVDEKLRPRILRGNPPELALCSLPIWLLMRGGQLQPIDLSLPAYDQPGVAWGETFLPGVLDMTTYGGQCLAIPTEFGGWVIWYDRKLWRDHGWQVPTTWEEFERLCERIKRTGLAPFAFQGFRFAAKQEGKVPELRDRDLLLDRPAGRRLSFRRETKLEAFAAIQNLDPGAWTAPPVLDFCFAAKRDSTPRGACGISRPTISIRRAWPSATSRARCSSSTAAARWSRAACGSSTKWRRTRRRTSS